METVYVRRVGEVRKNKKELEAGLGVKIGISGGKVSFSGDAVGEYDALKVLDAINFGFSAKKTMALKDEDFVFKTVHIRDYTNRNLRVIKSRLIGTKGKTREIVSRISDCEILITDSDVGIIGHVENAESAETAIINMIKGSKQSNVYRYLERMNRLKKEEEI